MIYQQSLGIERRLDETLEMIRTGEHSTPSLAKALKVSIPTVSRCITALRERGHDIRSIRGPHGWHYVLASVSPAGISSGRAGSRSKPVAATSH